LHTGPAITSAIKSDNSHMADSALNAYLRVAKLLLSDAERELPPKTWRALRDMLLIALRGRRA